MSDAAPRPPAWRGAAGFAVGLALLGAAVWAVSTQGGSTAETWARVRGAPAGLLAAAVLLPLVNLALSSQALAILTRRYGPVGSVEMAVLVGAAWLLNYLPLRPGMLGRVAYHKTVNGIAVRDSAKVLLAMIGVSAAAVGALLGMVLAAGSLRGGNGPWADGALLCAPLAVAGGWWALGRGRLGAAATLRYADVLVWTARYWVVFALIGVPIGPRAAAAMAAVSQAALLVPLAGNGLGLREWAVGLTAAMLPAGVVAAVPGAEARDAGLAADLANRAAELAAAVPVGLVCWWFVRRRFRPGG